MKNSPKEYAENSPNVCECGHNDHEIIREGEEVQELKPDPWFARLGRELMFGWGFWFFPLAAVVFVLIGWPLESDFLYLSCPGWCLVGLCFFATWWKDHR